MQPKTSVPLLPLASNRESLQGDPTGQNIGLCVMTFSRGFRLYGIDRGKNVLAPGGITSVVLLTFAPTLDSTQLQLRGVNRFRVPNKNNESYSKALQPLETHN